MDTQTLFLDWKLDNSLILLAATPTGPGFGEVDVLQILQDWSLVNFFILLAETPERPGFERYT